MRKVPKYITFSEIKRTIQLYCRGKDKFEIMKITTLNQKAVESIIENYANQYIKNVHRHRYIDKHIENTIIRACKVGIGTTKIAKYFKVKYDVISYIMRKRKLNMNLRCEQYKKRNHEHTILNKEIKRVKKRNLSKQRREEKKEIRKALILQEDEKNKKLPIPIYDAKTLNKNYFSIIDNEEKAYWLGFLAGDGNITNQTVTISLSFIDIEHIVKFKNALNNNNNLLYYANYSYDKVIGSRIYTLHITNKTLTNDLRKYGLYENKSFTVCMPYNLSHKLKKHYIRGIIDADGSIYFNKQYSCLNIAGNYQMLSDINDYFIQELNLKAKISEANSIYQLQYSFKKAWTVLYFIYENANIYLNRKYEKYLQFKKYIVLTDSNIGFLN